MDPKLAEVITDLQEEQGALERVLEQLTTEEWDRPTHAPGWLVRDQVAHLAWFDEAAGRAIAGPEAFEEESKSRLARRIPEGDPEHYLMKARGLSSAELLDWWRQASSSLCQRARDLDPEVRLPWYGQKMSGVSFLTARLMETWSHGLDVVDVVSPIRPDTDRLRHVAFLGVRTRAFSYANRRMEANRSPVRVVLTAPSGAVWELGEPSDIDVVRGTATDFCRVVTQRRNLADTQLEVRGDAAREWMGIAQAFAGPPGRGRQPGEFSVEEASDG